MLAMVWKYLLNNALCDAGFRAFLPSDRGTIVNQSRNGFTA